jgi:Spx/MgsR family transcriptional regulator
MSLKVYQYPNCSTCRKALKWLDARGLDHTAVDITVKPPSKKELKGMLDHYDGDLRRLFNTSGVVYRELKIKDRLAQMTKTEAIDLLSGDGKLIKRPFLLTDHCGLVGFKEDEWAVALT